MAAGGAALYALGSRVQWIQIPDLGAGWTAYSHDPAGYGFQLHWFAAPDGFEVHGGAGGKGGDISAAGERAGRACLCPALTGSR